MKALDNIISAIKLSGLLRALYASEINCGIQSFWDGHWSAWLGDDMNGRVVEEHGLKFDEIAPWLNGKARQHYPNSKFYLTKSPFSYRGYAR